MPKVDKSSPVIAQMQAVLAEPAGFAPSVSRDEMDSVWREVIRSYRSDVLERAMEFLSKDSFNGSRLTWDPAIPRNTRRQSLTCWRNFRGLLTGSFEPLENLNRRQEIVKLIPSCYNRTDSYASAHELSWLLYNAGLNELPDKPVERQDKKVLFALIRESAEEAVHRRYLADPSPANRIAKSHALERIRTLHDKAVYKNTSLWERFSAGWRLTGGQIAKVSLAGIAGAAFGAAAGVNGGLGGLLFGIVIGAAFGAGLYLEYLKGKESRTLAYVNK